MTLDMFISVHDYSFRFVSFRFANTVSHNKSVSPIDSVNFYKCNVNCICSVSYSFLSVVCKKKVGIFESKAPPLVLRIFKDRCDGCKDLEDCTTYEGSIQIQSVRRANDIVMKQLRFPKLTEITGHLLVSLVFGERSLKEIFPKLGVIRGRELFLGYSLVIYNNNGLEEVNLPSLTTILDGGVRIEKNINLCYVKTIRWKSVMRNVVEDEYSLVLNSNNNDCYDACFQTTGEQKKCTPPPGHGSLTNQHCWAPGNQQNDDCQRCE